MKKIYLCFLWLLLSYTSNIIAQQAIQSEVYEIQQGFSAYTYTQKILSVDDDNFIAFSQTILHSYPITIICK
ncbi:MAG: hypothetical protein LBR17_01795 [Bacteroidales bacterium]|jgi:hypothetical protein|nr:hypothetical protein [Bacteroidales bacterium]